MSNDSRCSSPYYRKVSSKDSSPVPSTWNMIDPEFREFIIDEFYWPKDEITPSLIQRLVDKYEANRFYTGENGHLRVRAPILVAIPTKSHSSTVLLMLIRHLKTSNKTGSCKATKNGNQVALINWEQKLKAIPSHLPLMCFEPKHRIDNFKVVYNSRANQSTWLVPEITHLRDDPDSIRLLWTRMSDKLEIHKLRQVSAILNRITWGEEGPWYDGPEERLLYNDSAYRCHRNPTRIRPPKILPVDDSTSEEDCDDNASEEDKEEEEERRPNDAFAYDEDDELESSYHPSIIVPATSSLTMRTRRSARLTKSRAYLSPRSRSPIRRVSHRPVELPSDDDEYVEEQPEPELPPSSVPVSPDLEPTEIDEVDQDSPEQPTPPQPLHIEAVRPNGTAITLPLNSDPVFLAVMERLEDLAVAQLKERECRQKEREEENDRRIAFEARLSRTEARQSEIEAQNLDQVRLATLQSESLDRITQKMDLMDKKYDQGLETMQKNQNKLMRQMSKFFSSRRVVHPRDSRRNPLLLSSSRSRSAAASRSHSRHPSESY